VAEAQKITNKINNIAPKKEEYEKKMAEIKDEIKKAEKKKKEESSVLGKVKGFFGSSKEEEHKVTHLHLKIVRDN
jgi:septal ring factor EnvC (AmiA/AmiB activator)